jgi:hypothetical protein
MGIQFFFHIPVSSAKETWFVDMCLKQCELWYEIKLSHIYSFLNGLTSQDKTRGYWVNVHKKKVCQSTLGVLHLEVTILGDLQ